MNKKIKITLLIAMGILVLCFLIGLIIYACKKTEITIKSNFSVTVLVSRSGEVKKIVEKNKDAKFITESLIVGKNIEECPKIIYEKAVKKEVLNKQAYSYNMYTTINSADDKLIEKYKEMIDKSDKLKLSNNAFIEVEYESCTCENTVCKKSC